MIFVLDNFDSFTYNIVQYLQQLDCEVVVRRNNAVSVDEVMAMNPEAIVLSPGPGRPEKAGIMVDLIERAKGRIPLLGICLGHQAIGMVFGGKVVSAKLIMHGKLSEITHDGRGVFSGLPSPLKVVRYHSLAVDRVSLPAELEISAESEDGEIMGMRHREYPIESLQYHPESILSSGGKRQLANFLKLASSFRERGC